MPSLSCLDLIVPQLWRFVKWSAPWLCLFEVVLGG